MKGLSKYRYLELKYFSLQYPELKEKLKAKISREGFLEKQNEWSDPTGEDAVIISELKSLISMIEKASIDAGGCISYYILLAVTLGLSFTTMKMQMGLPCERDMFYDRRRKYFMLLDKLR